MLQVINVFTSACMTLKVNIKLCGTGATYENDRRLSGSYSTEGSSSLCMPIQLGHYHTSDVDLIWEKII